MGNYQRANTVPAGVLADYFATMRQFLVSQETVMTHYLGAPQGTDQERMIGHRGRIFPAYEPVDSQLGVAGGEQSVAIVPAVLDRPPSAIPPVVATPSVPSEAAAPAPAVEEASQSDSGAMDRDATAKKLYAIIEDTTGYPQDMVGPDQNLEGDLGIDSIKRVEIVGNLLQELPAVYADSIGDGRKELVSAATLNGMLDILGKVDVGAPA